MNRKDHHIFSRGCHTAAGQIHNPFKSGAGRNQVADTGKDFIFCHCQISEKGNRHKYDHNDFNVNHTHHQSIRYMADDQAGQCRYKGRQYDQHQHNRCPGRESLKQIAAVTIADKQP